MTYSPIHLVSIGAALFALSAFITWRMTRSGILDIPNARSSHDRPVPRAGGVALVTAVSVGVVIYLVAVSGGWPQQQLGLVWLAALGVAAIGWLDDLGRVSSFRIKLAIQILAAVVVVAAGITISHLNIPGLGRVDLGPAAIPVTMLWVVAVTNFFNFMDGLDGIAAGVAIVASVFFAAIAFESGLFPAAVLACLIAVSSAGFLVFNIPPAKIFMGDVGSQFIGFLLASLAAFATQDSLAPDRVSFLVMPLLLFTFLFDATLTILRRQFAGEAITQAHRSHLYQLANRLGASHLVITACHAIAAVALGALAIHMVDMEAAYRGLIFVPVVAAHAIYAAIVLTRARRAALLNPVETESAGDTH